MKPKYYTPTIEELITTLVNRDEISQGEFKIGYTDLIPIEDTIHSFIEMNDCKVINYSDGSGQERMYSIPVELYKLKYLDQQDIESLGFNYGDFCKKTIKSEIIDLHLIDNHIWTIEAIGDDYRDQLFRGTIKNKSELKVLLKQLGI